MGNFEGRPPLQNSSSDSRLAEYRQRTAGCVLPCQQTNPISEKLPAQNIIDLLFTDCIRGVSPNPLATSLTAHSPKVPRHLPRIDQKPCPNPKLRDFPLWVWDQSYATVTTAAEASPLHREPLITYRIASAFALPFCKKISTNMTHKLRERSPRSACFFSWSLSASR